MRAAKDTDNCYCGSNSSSWKALKWPSHVHSCHKLQSSSLFAPRFQGFSSLYKHYVMLNFRCNIYIYACICVNAYFSVCYVMLKCNVIYLINQKDFPIHLDKHKCIDLMYYVVILSCNQLNYNVYFTKSHVFGKL